ncbi:hypothetical protein [Bifidobacterium pseudolongum]|uniref:hypothetical protein n=1 Tax=Bifidobacterium pseudolongum TaxID=1694 RepID=UPI0013EE1101|nr:hypothetical protein [Bifidobacterium pseudolongum]
MPQNSADCRPMGLPGEKEKDRCGGMNAAVFVELMVVEIYVDITPFSSFFIFLW